MKVPNNIEELKISSFVDVAIVLRVWPDLSDEQILNALVSQTTGEKLSDAQIANWREALPSLRND